MRLLSSILLILLYSLGLFRGGLPHAFYQLSQDYIVENLCENRDRPELKCNGKCFLMKLTSESASHKDESGKSPLPVEIESVEMAHLAVDPMIFDGELHDHAIFGVCNAALPLSISFSPDIPPPKTFAV